VTRLVRSAYLDTNVYAEAAGSGPLCAPSELVLRFANERRLGAVGSILLRRELLGVCRRLRTRSPLHLYERAVILELPASRSARYLGRLYASELAIKGSDALHLGFAAVVGADVLVSWNREDLAKEKTRAGLREINNRLGRKTPAILTPKELIEQTNATQRWSRLSLR
jgi:predicted nucleic acid-binding protein